MKSIRNQEKETSQLEDIRKSRDFKKNFEWQMGKLEMAWLLTHLITQTFNLTYRSSTYKLT